MVKPQTKPAAKKAVSSQRSSPNLAGGLPVEVALQMLNSNKALLTEMASLRAQVAKQNETIEALYRDLMNAAFESAPAANDGTAEPTMNRAAKALKDMRTRLGSTPASRARAVNEQEHISEAVKQSWIADGLLVGSAALADAWGCSRQALEQACERDELFSLKINGRRWYPASAMTLSAEAVKSVCAALAGMEPVARFITWETRQGSLGGLTLAQAIKAGRTNDAIRVAHSLADEVRTAHAAEA